MLFVTLAAAPATMPAVTPNDYSKLVKLSPPAISPDGKFAALVVSRYVWDDDRTTRDLVLVDLATRAQHILVEDGKGLSSPVFSPDGMQLAYLADRDTADDAKTEVFSIPVAQPSETAPQALTNSPSDVDEFAWRPDGRALVYAASDPDPQRRGAERFRDSFVFTTEPIVSHESPKPDHLFLQGLGANAPAVQLTSGSQSVGDGSTLSWSPDGGTVAFTLTRNAILNDQSWSRVALVDVASKAVRPLTGRSMWEGSPLFSPDGTHIAYLYSDGDEQVNLTKLYVTTPRGGPGHVASAGLDRNVSGLVWSHDSQSLLIAVPDATTNAFYRQPLRGAAQRLDVGTITPGSPLTTTGGAGTPDLTNAVSEGGTLAFVASSTMQPPELYVRTPDGQTSRTSDFNAALTGLAWSTAQRITFPTTTGVTGDGVLYLPPGFSSRNTYPVVVYLHGGPGDPSMTIFDFWAQVMAARGWLVLRPNYRGSPNLGLKYQRAILYDPEDGPGKDVMSALAVVQKRGIVDRTRMAVSGWSYGGIMTAWLISKYHVWRAAVSGASVNDWITDYGTADDSLADADLLHGSPFVGSNAAEWHRVSAITYARDVTTPVLILSDVGDNRDPFATSSMYWRALRDNGKDATLRVWPISGHFPEDPVRIVDVFHYWIGYIAHHFGSATAADNE
jgi:dipeptidyl aminopeptidase/acylaminoacyl peptidase